MWNDELFYFPQKIFVVLRAKKGSLAVITLVKYMINDISIIHS